MMGRGFTAFLPLWIVLGLLGVLVWQSPTVHGAMEEEARAGKGSESTVEPGGGREERYKGDCRQFRGPAEGREKLKQTLKTSWEHATDVYGECCKCSGEVGCTLDEFDRKGGDPGYKRGKPIGCGAVKAGGGFMNLGLGFVLIWIIWTLLI